MENISAFIKRADDLVWGPAMLLLLLGTGIYLMLRLRFLPIKNLKRALLLAVTNEKKGSSPDIRVTSGKGISSFSSLTTELAATIGTGNIVGVATAMVLGGPGALFWMMVSAFFGMAVKLVESMLSVKYRSRNCRGELVGGPMYTLMNAFPWKRTGKRLGSCFAIFAVLVSFGMGNMTQSNSIAAAMKEAFDISEYKTGLVVAVLTLLAVLGGIRILSKVTMVLVPVMGSFYIAGALTVLLFHWRNIPGSLAQIMVTAFFPQAIGGGAAGYLTGNMFETLRWGVSRGVFSNEAGLGASGISAAAADTENYIRQAYISMTGVFLDTMVICLLSGLSIAASGVLGMTDENGMLLTGTALTFAAFSGTFGRFGVCFVCICITLLAFSTIVGWAYQGEKAFEFLVRRRGCSIFYRIIYGVAAFVGAVVTLGLVWDFSDICNGLMAIPNLICVLVLSKEACREIRSAKI